VQTLWVMKALLWLPLIVVGLALASHAYGRVRALMELSRAGMNPRAELSDQQLAFLGRSADAATQNLTGSEALRIGDLHYWWVGIGALAALIAIWAAFRLIFSLRGLVQGRSGPVHS
jgi:hypothetical protein